MTDGIDMAEEQVREMLEMQKAAGALVAVPERAFNPKTLIAQWNEALERAAQVAERDVDWTEFGKKNIEPWEGGPDRIRDYRLGLVAARAIAVAIRREKR